MKNALNIRYPAGAAGGRSVGVTATPGCTFCRPS